MKYQLARAFLGLLLFSTAFIADAEQQGTTKAAVQGEINKQVEAGSAPKESVVAELKKTGVQPVQLAMRDTDNRVSSAALKAVIDLEDQEMRVYLDGDQEYTWKVSTARAGYVTPNGTYKAQWLSRMHYSKKFDDAPMPYSVFFHDGYAIHGTDSISRLGRPASHGCVRLHPDNAKTLFDLVKRVGKSNATIQIVGTPPISKVERSYRREDGRLNHRPIYEGRLVPSRRSSRSSDSSECLGCSNMSSFGRIPSIH